MPQGQGKDNAELEKGEELEREGTKETGSSKSWVLLLVNAGMWSSVSLSVKKNYSHVLSLLCKRWRVCLLLDLQALPRSVPACFVCDS